MAEYLDAASGRRSQGQLDATLSVFVKLDQKTLSAGIPASTNSIRFASAISGFLPEYQNSNGDLSNQTHHFAAFFEFGYKYRATAAAGLGITYELAESFNDQLGFNRGDVNLAVAAGNLGALLHSGKIQPGELETIIRQTICKQ